MISIRKYLDRTARKPEEQIDTESRQAGWAFSSALLECIARYVSTGAKSDALRSRVEALKDSLSPEWTLNDARNAETSVARILAEHAAVSRRTSLNQAVEIQHIFGMLNQALIVLAEGKDQSVSRLSHIQKSLERISQIPDILTMKSSLRETVDFIKAESTHAQEAATQELGRLEAEVSQAREFLSDAVGDLAGRPEAIASISEQLKNPDISQSFRLIAYSMDRLQAIIIRYGPAIAGELVFRLIRERLQPVAPAGATYRWTPSSLVVIFQGDGNMEVLRAAVVNLNRLPLVHRVALGNRTAVLTITPSHLVAEGVMGAPALIAHVDRFAGLKP